MGPEIILAALSSFLLTSIASVFSWITARFSERRSRDVESQVIQALGLPDVASQQEIATSDREIDLSNSISELQRLIADAGKNSGQKVVVNIVTNTASESLSEVAKRDSESHTRLVVKYYAQGHQQAFITFLASVTFATVGFIVILGAAIFLLMNPNQPEPAALTGAVGLINQGISYLFFRRADKARATMLQLIDKLREDREKEIRFIAGVVASDSIVAPSLRDAVRAATAVQSFGSNFTPEQLQLIASVANTAQQHIPAIHIHPHPAEAGAQDSLNSEAVDSVPNPVPVNASANGNGGDA
ncbi:hypothetical protein AB0K00_08120 [Dactylosporangium sp. NPDC049525]|uniref:TRADD-N-associated membrane domain-containing protein n=1 Tax=Dactylosporangium sp. NPDC049525 TaxID=3154730 RepID=UPI00341993D2